MKWKLLSIILAATFVLAACNGGTNDNGNGGNEEGQNGDNNVEQTRFDGDDDNTDNMNNGNRTPNNDGNNGNNENQYEMADEAAERIADQVDSIDNAYVIKTDNNAYVAAELDRDNNNGDNNNNNNGNNNGNNNDNNGNNNANIDGITNNNNNNNEGGEITDAVKEEISGIVRTVDPDVDNVYVSTNPDFFDLAGNYANDADSGEPVEGLFDQMGNMIERVFPQQNNN
ncbi:YhcN/YlaJ family sporulation lipoprotein [Lentibacillus jeotgali]|uniref:YhcN/YlaJ family sporulation lipoprotein n=1 Tax=Lentibacillus jeotgali TaxID=558169 RepID=UPI0002626BE2|nr:YhcN/YlaJ family sporulation lipoprotein [Lentibacillus jeotgali]